jgi:hypothetical protein
VGNNMFAKRSMSMKKGSKKGMSAVGRDRDEEYDLNMGQLLRLKLTFDRADRDRGGSLDLEEFRAAFSNIPGFFGDNEEAVDRMFMKVRTFENGKKKKKERERVREGWMEMQNK